MTKPLALTDARFREVRLAAKSLLPSQRADFLTALANRLGAEPSDFAVTEAIAAVLSANKIPAFCK
jgi:hypothetical protein